MIEGHLESVSLSLKKVASLGEVREALRTFEVDAALAALPTAIRHPVVVLDDEARPQPRRDVNAGNGMAAVVGRIRPCPILDVKLTLLSHNLVRGAAGAALLNAELLAARGFFARRVSAIGRPPDRRTRLPLTSFFAHVNFPFKGAASTGSVGAVFDSFLLP